MSAHINDDLHVKDFFTDSSSDESGSESGSDGWFRRLVVQQPENPFPQTGDAPTAQRSTPRLGEPSAQLEELLQEGAGQRQTGSDGAPVVRSRIPPAPQKGKRKTKTHHCDVPKTTSINMGEIQSAVKALEGAEADFEQMLPPGMTGQLRSVTLDMPLPRQPFTKKPGRRHSLTLGKQPRVEEQGSPGPSFVPRKKHGGEPRQIPKKRLLEEKEEHIYLNLDHLRRTREVKERVLQRFPRAPQKRSICRRLNYRAVIALILFIATLIVITMGFSSGAYGRLFGNDPSEEDEN